MNVITATLVSLILLSCSQWRSKDGGEMSIPENLQEALDSESRAPENVRRDKYVHPGETLEFFGVKPDLTVVEVYPGAGYYAEILAPYLAKEGQYVIAIPRLPPNPPAFMIENERKLQNILLRHQEVHSKARFVPFEPFDEKNRIRPEFADMALNFNNVHNWVANDITDMAFKFLYDVLKPGGILGIVQHRIPEGKKKVPKSGYMTESEVIAMAEKAGLKFVAKSEINANPKDTADYPGGVWTLPPTYRYGKKNRDRYEAIGESDKMTLKFIKED